MKGVTKLFFGLALAGGLSLAVACSTNPVTGKSQLILISEQEEIAMGKQYFPIATQISEGELPHGEIQRLVGQVGEKMARTSERPNLPWEFSAVDSNEPNAYALPGGKISITRGLLSRLESEDQLAAVLGHEVGHVTARHGVVAQSRDALLGLVLGVGGAVLQSEQVTGAGAIELAGQVGAALLTSKYSRDQERQADELGMKYMAAAGYNPRGFLESMQVLAAASKREPSKFETLFSSHPLTSERIAAAEQKLASGYAPEAQKLPRSTLAFAEAASPLKAEAPAFALADEGKELAQQRKTAEAAQKLERAAGMVPRSPILHALWGDALYDLKEYSRAEEASARANSLNGSLFYGRLVAGAAKWRLGRFRESLAELEIAERLVPETTLVAYFRGRNWEDLGDRQAAAEEYLKVARATGGRGEYGEYAVARLREWGYLQG